MITARVTKSEYGRKCVIIHYTSKGESGKLAELELEMENPVVSVLRLYSEGLVVVIGRKTLFSGPKFRHTLPLEPCRSDDDDVHRMIDKIPSADL